MLSTNNVLLGIFILIIQYAKGSASSSVPILNSTRFYIVSTILAEPFMMLKEEGSEGKEPKYEGFIPDLLDELSLYVGVHFKYSLAKDGTVGEKKADGTWSGIIGEVIGAKADLGAGPIVISSKGLRFMDFSKPFMNTGLTVVVNDPPDDVNDVEKSNLSSAGKALLVFSPFTVYAWLLLVAACVLVLVFAIILRRFIPDPDEKHGNTSCLTSALNTVMSFRVGGPWSTCTFRFTCVCFVLLTLILYTAGAVSLLLHMTRIKYHSPTVAKSRILENIDLQDIINSELYTLRTVKGGQASDFFRYTTVPMYNKISKDVDVNWVDSVAEGFKLLRKAPSTAFITDSAFADYYMMRKPYCNMERIGLLTVSGYGIALPIRSPLYDSINICILSMLEDGTMEMLHKKWWHDRSDCERPMLPAEAHKLNAENSAVKVDGPSIGGALIILAVGLVVTMIMAIIERRLATSKVNVGRQNRRDMDDNLLHSSGSRGESEMPLA